MRGTVEVRAVADPERATHVVQHRAQVAGGAVDAVGTDSTSPVYTVFDDLAPLGLAAGTRRATGRCCTTRTARRSISAVRRCTVGRTAVDDGDAAVLPARRRLQRSAAPDWGLHMWGDAVDPAVLAQIAWDKPWPRAVDDGWAVYDIPLVDDTKPVNFIMHLPSGDTVPTTREPGGDRSFLPLDRPDGLARPG